MSITTGATNSSANTALTLLQPNAQTASDATAADTTAATTASTETAADNTKAPIDTVHLSDRAKAILERNKIEQAVADRLQAALDQKDGGTGKAATAQIATPVAPKPKTDISGPGAEIVRTYGNLHGSAEWAREANVDNIGLIKSGFGNADKWLDFAQGELNGEQLQEPGLTPDNPDYDKLFQNGVNYAIAQHIIELRQNGQTDKAEALKTAFNNGTIKVQKVEDVPGLNYNAVTTHFADAGDGGTSTTTTFHPTGDLKKAWEDGDFIVIGGGDRGSFYLTWDLPASKTAAPTTAATSAGNTAGNTPVAKTAA